MANALKSPCSNHAPSSVLRLGSDLCSFRLPPAGPTSAAENPFDTRIDPYNDSTKVVVLSHPLSHGPMRSPQITPATNYVLLVERQCSRWWKRHEL